ncbi:unnamed protein product [Pylaiella littoralis]
MEANRSRRLPTRFCCARRKSPQRAVQHFSTGVEGALIFIRSWCCYRCHTLQIRTVHARLVQGVFDRQNNSGRNLGYCMAARVRDEVLNETAKDLECTGVRNQCPPAKRMTVFAGKGNCTTPIETVRALCKFQFLRSNCALSLDSSLRLATGVIRD